jgi:outer membrane protein assembly factor BamB
MNARLWLLAAVLVAAPAAAADWPQWRGPNRDAKVGGFDAPATWPKELTKKWKVTIGDGVATPALVGDKLYTYSREGGDEVIRCLDAVSGKELWQDKNPATAPRGPAAGFPGPRASPAVANGKVVTLGVAGLLSCYDAATGSKVWRKNEIKAVPGFSTASSPLIVDGLCVVQLGGDSGGSVCALDLATGEQKWTWESDGTKFASPYLLTVGDTKAIVAETAGNIVAVNLADGKLLWKTPFKTRYNAATPVVDDKTVIYSGPTKGTTAMAVEKSADGLAAKELWSNSRTAVQFNTPVVKDGLVYGIATGGKLFCLDAKSGTTAWTSDLKAAGRYADYGSVVDAGAVLFALNPSGELVVFEPNGKEFKKVASYKVADGSTFAYPVIADKRIFIKDKNDVTLWTIE